MGATFDCFAARTDALAATVLAKGPSASGLDIVEVKGLDPVVDMATLEELLTGQPFAVVIENQRLGAIVAGREHDPPCVLSMTSTLQASLLDATRAKLEAVAFAWSLTGRLADQDESALLTVVLQLAGLARRTASSGESLYCWVCL